MLKISRFWLPSNLVCPFRLTCTFPISMYVRLRSFTEKARNSKMLLHCEVVFKNFDSSYKLKTKDATIFIKNEYEKVSCSAQSFWRLWGFVCSSIRLPLRKPVKELFSSFLSLFFLLYPLLYKDSIKSFENLKFVFSLK